MPPESRDIDRPVLADGESVPRFLIRWISAWLGSLGDRRLYAVDFSGARGDDPFGLAAARR